MNPTEELLARALRHAVADVEAEPDALDRLLARTRRTRRPVKPWLAVAAALVMVVAAALLRSGDDPEVHVATTAPAPPLPPVAERVAAARDDHLDVLDARTGTVVRHHRLPPALRHPDPLPGFTAGKQAVVLLTATRAAWTVDLETGRATHLLNEVRFLAFSPDGSSLAYVPFDSNGSGEIVVRQLDSGTERRFHLSPGSYTDFTGISSVVWRPDGTRLAFTRGHYGYDTYVLDPGAESDLSALEPAVAKFAIHAWSPGGALYGFYYCCAEAEPPVPVVYDTRGRTLLDPLPAGAGLVDANDLDGRYLAITTRQSRSPALVVEGHRLPGYTRAAW
ncbi:MAG: WD40-like Beta Propeller Repeat [Acidimicrobiales bacterium]|nr:WD40-like Beta Propeller Repeat [Acidimicrobiales bacterium]